MAYNAKPWLRRVAAASVSGMSDRIVEERGFQIMLDSMRAAYIARHPDSPLAIAHRPTTPVTPDLIRGPASSEQR
ncbi:MAG: hypothetical protein Q8R81_09615 [Novosphingobium sp.]|uniref:hypothetical protein n=1 Tax=Novosphingobium sp. TaxID=1874826 RepID=UPI002735F712|nr:hypothetical protein [Novosphingobium sp.]MDP3550642.1 hypothetical protein [Novosphingobium sp.]